MKKIYFTCVFPICGCFLHDEIQKERLKSVPSLPVLRICVGISPRPDICKATDVFLKHTLAENRAWLPALEGVKACLEIMGKLSVNQQILRKKLRKRKEY